MAYLDDGFRYPSDGDKKTLLDRQLVSQRYQESCQQPEHERGRNASQDQAQLLYTYLWYLEELQICSHCIFLHLNYSCQFCCSIASYLHYYSNFNIFNHHIHKRHKHTTFILRSTVTCEYCVIKVFLSLSITNSLTG